MKKVVLAYSGGLDTSVAIRWLMEKYGVDVVTVTVDVGQQEDFKAIEERAYKIGVKKHYTIDAKKEFAEKFVFQAVKANALYEEKYPLSTALSRPLIALKLVEIAELEDADAVAHGCTGKGNDQLRFEITIKALNPRLKVLAPIRDWKMSRAEEIEYAVKHGIPIPIKSRKYSIDQNLWGRSIEGGELEDPSIPPPEDAFEWTVLPEKAPDEAKLIDIEFEEGIPVSVNGERLDAVELITRLNKVVGAHGVGRIDHMEDRVVGFKSREVYECPAAIALIEAHKDLEKLVLNRRELEFKKLVDSAWSYLIYAGLWADPLREELDAFINKANEKVTGVVKLKLYKGSIMPVARSSPYSSYSIELATYGQTSAFDQSLSKGFIELWGLPTILSSIARKKEGFEWR
ncbi:MAG: argininosuccinate synthase [Candidatus Methanomethylicota archaeon]|uniref:Argininosuccinate synthase n=1 Tax=Thermoproteota archaeon TaxID=2056631 RepID=A0A497EUB1_9CREN|nr:MAG: argininosuccinate synthase [Candidatus Verstraetearchaeota archaeon]